jgi:peptidoglycan hydrolase CwlO-like protein
MKPSAFLFAALLFAAASQAAAAVTATPTPRKGSAQPIAVDSQPGQGVAGSATSQSVLSDVANAYDQMEKNIELQFAKLILEAKSNKEAVEDKIKSIEAAIEKLKQEVKKLELLLQKLEELLPKIMAALGSDPGAGKGRAPSTARLGAELGKAGINLSADELRSLADAIGQGGMLAARKWAEKGLAATNNAIDPAQQAKKALKDQIAALEKALKKLQLDRDKALAELRVQKQKALDQARKAQDSRIILAPTPTPKKP